MVLDHFTYQGFHDCSVEYDHQQSKSSDKVVSAKNHTAQHNVRDRYTFQ